MYETLPLTLLYFRSYRFDVRAAGGVFSRERTADRIAERTFGSNEVLRLTTNFVVTCCWFPRAMAFFFGFRRRPFRRTIEFNSLRIRDISSWVIAIFVEHEMSSIKRVYVMPRS